MTFEKAKIEKEQVLKNLEDIVRFGGLMMSSELVESVRIAMVAYEQEPCEDAISRDEVMTIVARKHLFKDKSDFDKCVHAIAKQIKALPSVHPKAKTGKWLVYIDCEGKTRQCVCDQCGYKTGKYTWKNPNFCENCGTKMEGESEDKE